MPLSPIWPRSDPLPFKNFVFTGKTVKGLRSKQGWRHKFLGKKVPFSYNHHWEPSGKVEGNTYENIS